MKKKLINITITIMIIIIIVSILILVIFLGKNNEEDSNTEETVQKVEYINNNIESISNNKKLFAVKNCIQDFIKQINVNNVVYYTGGERIEQSIISKWTYSLLSTEYINNNNITEDNVYNYVNNIEEKLTFIPLKINVLECKSTTRYAIYGFTCTQTNEYKEDVYFILNVDNNNNTYSIEPILNAKSIDEIKLNSEDLVIQPNRYNTYEEKDITDEDICQLYLSNYKTMMLSNSELAYNYLDNEYKDKKFGELKNYENYIMENKNKISQSELENYKINGSEYICVDQWENYYVFNINEILNYNVILDTYTVDLPEFTEKYNQGNDQQKVVLNINKIFTAIDAKDYKYVYSKLAESFKNNYFNNESDLQKYLNDNLFEKNNVSYEEYAREGELYTYKVYITDNNNTEDSKQVKMNIVMQLKEGTDFVMSFSIEK